MNKYQHTIKQARIKYPLRRIALVNPPLAMMVDEYGNEFPESKIKNEVGTKVFIEQLKYFYEIENGL